MNKKEILNEMIKAGILSESDAQIVHYNIHQLEKLAKADTPEQKKILNTLRFELLQIIFAPCVYPPQTIKETKLPRTPTQTQKACTNKATIKPKRRYAKRFLFC